MSSEIVVTNTIAFVFPDNAAQPTLPEMVRFVKGLTGDQGKMDTAYKNAEERTVFIKYKSEEGMREALSRNEEKQTFHYSNGTQVDVCMSVAGNIQYIRVFDLPPEVSDRDLAGELSKYGKIKRCLREKYPPEYQLDLFTGVRGIYMEVEKEVPPVLYFHNRRGRIFYSGNKKKCFTCGQEGHHKKACGKKKVKTTGAGVEKKEAGKSTFAAILSGTSSSDNVDKQADLEIEMLDEDNDDECGTTQDGELDHEKQRTNQYNKQPVLHYQPQKQQKVGNWTEYVQMHKKLLKQQKKEQKYANGHSSPWKTLRPNSTRSGTGSD